MPLHHECMSCFTAAGACCPYPPSRKRSGGSSLPARPHVAPPCGIVLVILQCMTAASLKTEAQAITGKVVSIPTGCKEVDTEFKCIRCADVSGGRRQRGPGQQGFRCAAGERAPFSATHTLI